MIDFLKIYPNISKQEYLWEWTIPQIQLSSCDFTRIEYIDDEEDNKNSTNKSLENASMKQKLNVLNGLGRK